jgi:hypothetical protein
MHALERVSGPYGVAEPGENPIVDLPVLGREPRGRREPIFELGWDVRVELDDLVFRHDEEFLYSARRTPPAGLV